MSMVPLDAGADLWSNASWPEPEMPASNPLLGWHRSIDPVYYSSKSWRTLRGSQIFEAGEAHNKSLRMPRIHTVPLQFICYVASCHSSISS